MDRQRQGRTESFEDVSSSLQCTRPVSKRIAIYNGVWLAHKVSTAKEARFNDKQCGPDLRAFIAPYTVRRSTQIMQCKPTAVSRRVTLFKFSPSGKTTPHCPFFHAAQLLLTQLALLTCYR